MYSNTNHYYYYTEYLKVAKSVLATSCEELTPWKRLWCWEGLGAGGEGDNREWDDWMASPTWWTWVWVNSRCWWWTERPGVLQFMGLQRVGNDWATELTDSCIAGKFLTLWATREALCLPMAVCKKWYWAPKELFVLSFHFAVHLLLYLSTTIIRLRQKLHPITINITESEYFSVSKSNCEKNIIF